MIDNLNEAELFALMALAAGCLPTVIAVCILAWKAYGPKKKGPIAYDSVPLPGITPFDGPGAECACQNACQIHSIEPESMRVNSNLTVIPRSKIPKTQVGIYSVDKDGHLVQYLGTATRLGDWLIAPHHVIVAHETIAILSNAPEPMAHKIKTDSFEAIEGDLDAMKVSERDFSKFGMVKAAIATMDGPAIVAITSSSKEPEISFGTLNHDTKVFGYVVYHGSTKGGFSGAPYMIGKQLAGIHLGGGRMNYGLSASYVHALLTKPEDTAEWLQKVKRRRGTLKYQRSKFNPDEAIVFVDGKFHTVDLSLVENEEQVEGVGPYDTKVYYPDRENEVNIRPSFPPQHREMAEVISDVVEEAVETITSKNLTVAEQCSAEQAQEWMTMYNGQMERMDEAAMMLQSLQNSVADRYRELQHIAVKAKEAGEERTAIIQEIEKIKAELSEIKHFKTFAHVEMSSVKQIPLPVKKAANKNKSEAEILSVLKAQGFDLLQVKQAINASLREEGILPPTKPKTAKKDAAGPVGNVAAIAASLIEAANMPRAKPSTSQDLNN